MRYLEAEFRCPDHSRYTAITLFRLELHPLVELLLRPSILLSASRETGYLPPAPRPVQTMARILSVFMLLLFYRVLHTSGKLVYAFLGDSVDLSPNCTEERFSLVHSSTQMSDTVADRISGRWMQGGKYRSRTEHSASSLFLLRVNYNDQGWYESKCGSSSFIPVIKLRVFVASLSVTVKETLKLPCHSLTAGKTFESISWERNGKVVIKLHVSSDEISYGTGFDGRVSVPSDWYSEGDLSLTVDKAELEDGGDYFCHVLHKGERDRKVVDAVRVNIIKRKAYDQTICTPLSVSMTFILSGWPLLL